MKKTLIFLVFSTWYLASVTSAYAVCPVCTVAIGAGLGLSRYFGIDDTISGLWIGGLILSSALWLADWLRKKGVRVKIQILNITSCIIFYLLVIVPLYLTSTIGHPYNTIYGIDKLVFGIALGSIAFIFALSLDKIVRRLNGRQFFPYQKVIFPVSALVVMSLIFYFALR